MGSGSPSARLSISPTAITTGAARIRSQPGSPGLLLHCLDQPAQCRAGLRVQPRSWGLPLHAASGHPHPAPIGGSCMRRIRQILERCTLTAPCSDGGGELVRVNDAVLFIRSPPSGSRCISMPSSASSARIAARNSGTPSIALWIGQAHHRDAVVCTAMPRLRAEVLTGAHSDPRWSSARSRWSRSGDRPASI